MSHVHLFPLKGSFGGNVFILVESFSSFSLNVSYLIWRWNNHICSLSAKGSLIIFFFTRDRIAPEQHRSQFRHTTAPGGVAEFTHSCLLCTHGCLGRTGLHPSETGRCQPGQWISQKRERRHQKKAGVCVCVSILRANTSVFFDLSIFLSLCLTHAC